MISFVGEDLNAGPGGPFTNSNTAAASFTAAASSIGDVATITFESAPLGAFSSLTAAPGVSISAPTGLSINNIPNEPATPTLDGFNVTPGGSQYLEDAAGAFTINFASPVQFFGIYLTGMQSGFAQDALTFNDGATQTIYALETGTGAGAGAVGFVGFTDAGKAISSVTVTSNTGGVGGDYIGTDDVMYQTSVPEPASRALAATALIGLLLVSLTKRVSS